MQWGPTLSTNRHGAFEISHWESVACKAVHPGAACLQVNKLILYCHGHLLASGCQKDMQGLQLKHGSRPGPALTDPVLEQSRPATCLKLLLQKPGQLTTYATHNLGRKRLVGHWGDCQSPAQDLEPLLHLAHSCRRKAAGDCDPAVALQLPAVVAEAEALG